MPGDGAAEAGVAGSDDRAVVPPELDAEDLARSRQRSELRLEATDLTRRRQPFRGEDLPVGCTR